MTLEMFVYFVWAITAFMAVTLVALIINGRRMARRMDAEFEERRRAMQEEARREFEARLRAMQEAWREH